jgi:hypothetical protein
MGGTNNPTRGLPGPDQQRGWRKVICYKLRYRGASLCVLHDIQVRGAGCPRPGSFFLFPLDPLGTAEPGTLGIRVHIAPRRMPRISSSRLIGNPPSPLMQCAIPTPTPPPRRALPALSLHVHLQNSMPGHIFQPIMSGCCTEATPPAIGRHSHRTFMSSMFRRPASFGWSACEDTARLPLLGLVFPVRSLVHTLTVGPVAVGGTHSHTS